MSLRSNLFMAAICVAAIPAFAQSNPEHPSPAPQPGLSHKVIYFGDESSSAEQSERDELVSKFYFDQFQHAHDPQAPYFMFMSKDASMALGIGGVFNALAYADWHGTIDDNGFVTYDIPMTSNSNAGHRIGSTMSQSQLFLRLFGKHDKVGWYQMYISAKFSGGGMNNYGFKLNKAYASVGDWTLGYTNTTFADPASCPNTVDPQGPGAEVSETTVLLRYMHTFKGNHWSVAASVETPGDQIPTYVGVASACNSYMPDVAGFLQYQWNDGAYHVRLSGIMRGLEYRDDIASVNHKALGWGAHLSTVSNPLPGTTFYGGVNVGKGIASLNTDLQNSSTGLDMLPDAGDPGRMHTTTSFAWLAALQYNFRSNFYSTVMFSQVRLYPGEGQDGDIYKYGLYGAANIFWNPTSRLTLGAEYDLGFRKNLTGNRHWVNRLGVTCQYSF